MSVRAKLLAVVYVVGIAVLAAATFPGHDTFSWSREGLLLLLTMPAIVVGLPVVYVAGTVAWNLSGADSGGPQWVVSLVYAVVFAAVAAADVALVLLVVRRRARRRELASG
ncbi:hypothetical protein [Cellulomonas edaphi]|uniref:Integral membrane protein n=1 Tax=Cellulomonas edaphi TaxID=3053468 RepID=A0ABT7S6W4_9CELL|nr:hypothetical protein [Cellulomons edaphi]MDM7831357.1 hypothetical protein [Cellulomons edaphi]